MAQRLAKNSHSTGTNQQTDHDGGGRGGRGGHGGDHDGGGKRGELRDDMTDIHQDRGTLKNADNPEERQDARKELREDQQELREDWGKGMPKHKKEGGRDDDGPGERRHGGGDDDDGPGGRGGHHGRGGHRGGRDD